MIIFLNGEPMTLVARLTVAQLLEERGLPRVGIAVERNREIVPRSRHAHTELLDGDRVEIVQFVGGG
jgi:thiamine biosynthesis protein ThiS